MDINSTIKNAEKQQILIASAVIMAAIGFKYVIKDFEEHCKVHFDSRIMKSLTVFSLVFLNTKNIPLSLFFTAIYNILHYILVSSAKVCTNEEQ